MRNLIAVTLALIYMQAFAGPYLDKAIMSRFAEATGYAGSGADGAVTIVGPTNGPQNPYFTDNTRTYLTAAAAAGATTLTVASSSGFAANNVVLVISMLGSTAGIYEFRTVSSIPSGTSIALSAALTNAYPIYSAGASVTQVLRVPQFTTVTLNSGGFMSARAFNGQTGGVVAFLASSGVTINYNATYSGRISAVGKGYQAGGTNAAGSGPGGGGVGIGGSNTSPGSGPVRLIMGSGGGGGSAGAGGVGGGIILFKTAGTLTVDGFILADGGAAPASTNGGGGSGGTLAISADTITRTSTCGTVTASGGAASGTGTTGGGGRIFWGFKTSNACTNPTPNAGYYRYIVK